MYDDEIGWWTHTVCYGEAIYAARCPHCARFVKTDDTATLRFESADLRKPNATCRVHGRIETPFLGWKGD